MTYAREMAEKAAASIIDIKHTRADVLEVTVKEVIDRCAQEADVGGNDHVAAAIAKRVRALASTTPVPSPTTAKETT